MNTLDFLWSSKKEYFSLKPLYIEAKKQGIDTRFKKIYKNIIKNYFINNNISEYVVILHDTPLKRIKKNYELQFG